MKRCYFTPDAKQDLNEIYDYIAADNRRAAVEYVETLQEICHLVAESPLIGRYRAEVGVNVRVFPARSHLLVYETRGDTVHMLRIIHGKRDLTRITLRRPGRKDE